MAKGRKNREIRKHAANLKQQGHAPNFSVKSIARSLRRNGRMPNRGS